MFCSFNVFVCFWLPNCLFLLHLTPMFQSCTLKYWRSLTLVMNTNRLTFRISHREFLKRYSLTLKHLDPGTRSHKPPPLALSPKKDNGHLKGTPVERLKRRSRRRHRSSYDHSRQICRSIVEVVGLDEAGGCKENKQERNCERVKIGRTKVFLQESAVIVKSRLWQKCWK